MTDRPSLQRKHTRTTQAKAQDKLDIGVKITLDGREYVAQSGDMTAMDSRELRKQVGVSFPRLLDQLVSEDCDIDTVAAVLWLARRLDGELMLRYEDVASEFTYEDFERVEFATPDAEPPIEDVTTADPEG